MEKIKNKSGRKKISVEMKKSNEYRIFLDDNEFLMLRSLRREFGEKRTASEFRRYLKELFDHFRLQF